MAVSVNLHIAAVPPVRKVPQYALNRRLGELLNRSIWRVGDEKDLLQVPGTELRVLGRWARSLAWTSITASEGEGRRKRCKVTVGKPLDATATNSNPAFLLHSLQTSRYTNCCANMSSPWGIYCWVQILLILKAFRPADTLIAALICHLRGEFIAEYRFCWYQIGLI